LLDPGDVVGPPLVPQYVDRANPGGEWRVAHHEPRHDVRADLPRRKPLAVGNILAARRYRLLDGWSVDRLSECVRACLLAGPDDDDEPVKIARLGHTSTFSRSARMRHTGSIPTDSRTRSGSTPGSRLIVAGTSAMLSTAPKDGAMRIVSRSPSLSVNSTGSAP